MILDETKLASAVLDGEEEAAPAEGDQAPTALLDGEEEAETPPSEEGAEAPSAPAEGGEEAV